MAFTREDLEILGFMQTHAIVLKDGIPSFQRSARGNTNERPVVYVWVCESKGTEILDILYVGKAGKGIHRRCRQHEGGFRHSGAGTKNADAIREILADDSNSITVFARVSDTQAIFGETVSLYSAEEDALCAKLGPRLNRAAFPNVAGSQRPDAPSNADALAEADQAANVTKTVVPEGQSVLGGTAEQRLLGDVLGIINRRLVASEHDALDDVLAELESYDLDRLKWIHRMFSFVETNLVNPTVSSNIIGGYTDQLRGCNGKTVMTFGVLGDAGRFKGGSWVARVFFTETPRFHFPVRLRAAGAADTVMSNSLVFEPLDYERFFQHPDRYLTLG